VVKCVPQFKERAVRLLGCGIIYTPHAHHDLIGGVPVSFNA